MRNQKKLANPVYLNPYHHPFCSPYAVIIMEKKKLYLLLAGLFMFRLIYGLCAEFWFADELQIYLIGLKSYTTGTWPFYGPDVVYTHTQIPGALQGLLVALPFYLWKLPELPTLILNVLSFSSLCMLAWYITRRVKGVPDWMVWILCMTTPWTLYYSTRVVNPSYVLVFSIPFFIAVLELLPIYTGKLIRPGLAYFIMGITTTFIMQLHMSWVLMVPYTLVAMAYTMRTANKKVILFYILGGLLGLLTLIPTWLHPDPMAGKVGENIVFNWSNFGNIVTILLRYLSFATYEIPYVLGDSHDKEVIFHSHYWMIPFIVFLLVIGFLQVGLLIIGFFIKTQNEEWKKMRWLNICSYGLLFCSFFFSIKGPSSHTFYILLPLPMIYSFYCYEWLISKKAVALKVLRVVVYCGFFFHIGLAYYNFQHKSIYKDRPKVTEALNKMDYRVLGERRSDQLGYGY